MAKQNNRNLKGLFLLTFSKILKVSSKQFDSEFKTNFYKTCTFIFIINSFVFSQFSPQITLSENYYITFNTPKSFIFDFDEDGDGDVLNPSGYEILVSENYQGGFFLPIRLFLETDQLQTDYMIMVDLNNDGKEDILAGSTNQSEVGWYQNNGNVNFSAPQIIISNLNNPNLLAASDFDNDGDKDILVGNNSLLYWFENIGNGVSFVEHLILSDPFNNATISDLDNDGFDDIVVYLYNNHEICWFKNLGSGNFSSLIGISTFESSVSVNTIRCIDINNDGFKDIIASSYIDGTIFWFSNDGFGGFNPSQLIVDLDCYLEKFEIGDVDNDGDQDVLTFNGEISDTLLLVENNQNGSFWINRIISKNIKKSNITLGDLDNNGFLDIVVKSKLENLSSIIFNKESGFFSKQYFLGLQISEASSHTINDFDGDGIKDIAWWDFNDLDIAWQKNLGNNLLGAAQKIFVNPNLYVYGDLDLFSFDVDEDGDNDCVANDSWFENDGTGYFFDPHVIENGLLIRCVDDIDNDGDIDIIANWEYNNPQTVVKKNMGGGNFSPYTTVANLSSYNNSLVVGDIDGDGDKDIISGGNSWSSSPVQTGMGDTLFWIENNGNGNFGAVHGISNQVLGIKAMKVSDLNQDGKLDVIAIGHVENEICWFENLGEGNFNEKNTIENLTSDPNDFSLIDFDNDDDLDIVNSNFNYGILSFENLGNGSFSNGNLFVNHESWTIPIWDINDDGDQDIVFTNVNSGNVFTLTCNLYHASQVSGNLYVDVNQNSQFDSTDVSFNSVGVNSTPESDYTFTNSTGHYFMNFSDTAGMYLIQPESLPNWSLVSDSLSYHVHVDSNYVTLTNLNFGFYPSTVVDSLSCDLIGGFPRCNSEVQYWINLKNIGTTIPSGYIDLLLDERITFISAEPAPDSINGFHYYWSFENLSYFSNDLFRIQLMMPDATNMGEDLYSKASAIIIDMDGAQTIAAIGDVSQTLVCAYDPNDKTSDPLGIDSLGYIISSTNSIDYTIRFQNTGNDTAFTVVIKDQLDPNFDWQSLLPLASSFSPIINVDQNGEITFRFNNIMLPDSNVNVHGSKGFIKYRINLKPDLLPETRILNSARIYFDLNPPIVTNTKINTLYDCGSIFDNISDLEAPKCKNSNYIYDGNLSTTNYSWSISSFHVDSSDSFQWLADTSGIFNLQLNAANPFCNVDTSIQIEVLPEPIIVIIDSSFICEGDSMMIFGSYQQTNNIYYHTLQSSLGCDSLIGWKLELFLEPPTQIDDSSFVCEGDSLLIFGSYQNSSGIYYNNLQTINGCDSIVAWKLSVFSKPIVDFGNFLEDTICLGSQILTMPNSTPSGGIYEGIGVSNNQFDSDIAGIGNHSIYYSFVDTNNCSSSDSNLIYVDFCADLNNLSVGTIKIHNDILKKIVTINFNNELSNNFGISLSSITGQVLFKKDCLNESSFQVHTDRFAKGMIFLTIIDNQTNKVSLSSKIIID